MNSSSAARLLAPVQINLELHAATADDAVRQIAELLQDHHAVSDFSAFCQEVLSREKVSSTALSSGVAFPHARTRQVKELVLAVGRFPEGVTFPQAKEPVHLIFLIGTPPAMVREYLGLLGELARTILQPARLEGLLKAATAEEFLHELSAGSGR